MTAITEAACPSTPSSYLHDVYDLDQAIIRADRKDETKRWLKQQSNWADSRFARVFRVDPQLFFDRL